MAYYLAVIFETKSYCNKSTKKEHSSSERILYPHINSCIIE